MFELAKRIEKHLLGKSIIKIEYMSEKDSKEQGWHKDQFNYF